MLLGRVATLQIRHGRALPPREQAREGDQHEVHKILREEVPPSPIQIGLQLLRTHQLSHPQGVSHLPKDRRRNLEGEPVDHCRCIHQYLPLAELAGNQ